MCEKPKLSIIVPVYNVKKYLKFCIDSILGQTFKDFETLSEEELIERGLNISRTHLDFMIGTPDLDISAETIEGKKLVFKKGNFNI